MVFAGDVFGEEKEGSWGDGQVLRATQRRGWVPPGPWGSMEGKIDRFMKQSKPDFLPRATFRDGIHMGEDINMKYKL